MPHIILPEGIPGIRSLAMHNPETAKPLYDLAQVLLRESSSLSPAERELITASVSSLNDCTFCMDTHAAAARELVVKIPNVVDCILDYRPTDLISDKTKSLLKIAAEVQFSDKSVNTENIEEERLYAEPVRQRLATLTPENGDAYFPNGPTTSHDRLCLTSTHQGITLN